MFVWCVFRRQKFAPYAGQLHRIYSTQELAQKCVEDNKGWANWEYIYQQIEVKDTY